MQEITWHGDFALNALQFERAVAFSAGFDCRRECEHDKKGDHGWRGDQFHLLVRQEDLVLSLSIGTAFLRGELKTGLLYESGGTEVSNEGRWFVLHSEKPTTPEAVRHGKPESCNYTRSGTCFTGHEASLPASRFWMPHSARMHILLERGGPEAYPARVIARLFDPDWMEVWWELARRLQHHRSELAAPLPTRCPHCDGTGLVSP